MTNTISNRITMKDLEAACERINSITGNPITSYTKVEGKLVANIGNYHLDGAYGGYDLHQMENEGGGVRSIFSGHFSKREIYNRMQAFIKGLESK